MSGKIIGGIAIGAAFTATVGSIFHAYKMKKKEIELAKLKSQVKTLTEEKETETKTHEQRCEKLMHDYANLCALNEKITQAFNIILNPDMIADIANIDNIEMRDACLSEIENCVSTISKYIIHRTEILSDEKLKEIIDKVMDHVNEMTTNIKKYIDDYNADIDDSDDEDVDEDGDDDVIEETVSPRKIILKGVNCEDKIFVVDPDIGFRVITIEDGDYCIYAQNAAKLYNFLKESIKEQSSAHYVAKIDPVIFENMMGDDVKIMISLRFINKTDAIVTSASTITPFEIFNDNGKFYQVEDGEVSHDNIIHFIRSHSNSSADVIRKENLPISSDEKIVSDPSQKVIKYTKADKPDTTDDIDGYINYIAETIGYNHEGLMAFKKRMNALSVIKPEAYASVYAAFIDIINNIPDKLTTEDVPQITRNLDALLKNIKTHYGAEIKAYYQSAT
jgi:hypothetical protein